MSDTEQKGNGYLIRSIRQKSKECIVLDYGTDYEVIIYYNGYDKNNRNGLFAVRSVGKEAHFYQYTNKMKKNPELEDVWYKKSLEVAPNSGFLNRKVRQNNGENGEHFVINKGTDYECKVYFNGIRGGNFGIVAVKRIGSKNSAFHVNKKILEDPIEGAIWRN